MGFSGMHTAIYKQGMESFGGFTQVSLLVQFATFELDYE